MTKKKRQQWAYKQAHKKKSSKQAKQHASQDSDSDDDDDDNDDDDHHRHQHHDYDNASQKLKKDKVQATHDSSAHHGNQGHRRNLNVKDHKEEDSRSEESSQSDKVDTSESESGDDQEAQADLQWLNNEIKLLINSHFVLPTAETTEAPTNKKKEKEKEKEKEKFARGYSSRKKQVNADGNGDVVNESVQSKKAAKGTENHPDKQCPPEEPSQRIDPRTIYKKQTDQQVQWGKLHSTDPLQYQSLPVRVKPTFLPYILNSYNVAKGMSGPNTKHQHPSRQDTTTDVKLQDSFRGEGTTVQAKLQEETMRAAAGEIGLDFNTLEFPKRPLWTKDMSRQQLEEQECQYFLEWLKKLFVLYSPDEDLNFFELNLDVWRQFWRVYERSDIILYLLDARCPSLHFSYTFYRFITKELGKGIVLVFTKSDLIPEKRRDEWIKYFENMLHLADQKYADDNQDSANSQISRHFIVPWISTTSGTSRIENDLNRVNRDRLMHAVQDCFAYTFKCDRGMFSFERESEHDNHRRRKKVEKSRLKEERRGKGSTVAKSKFGDLTFDESFQINDKNNTTNANEVLSPTTRKSNASVKKKATVQESEEEQKSDGSQSESTEEIRDNMDNESQVVGSKNVPIMDFSQTPSDTPMASFPFQHMGYLTLGMIGEPNMGKSSLLNNLLGHKKVKVSATPGCTKKFQTHFYNKNICLCDCPGVVLPRLHVPKSLQILTGTYPISQVREPFTAIRYFAERCNPRLDTYYQLVKSNEDDEQTKDVWSAYDLAVAYADQQGFMLPKGNLDVSRSGNLILRNALSGNKKLASSATSDAVHIKNYNGNGQSTDKWKSNEGQNAKVFLFPRIDFAPPSML